MTKADAILAAIIGQLVNADQLAEQYTALTGVKIGPFYDPKQFAGSSVEPAETPIWDAEGVSQPMKYGMVMLRDLEDLRARLLETVPADQVAKVLPSLVACVHALRKAVPGSDEYWILQTETSWAAFGALGTNQQEAFGVNLFDVVEGDPTVQLPSERLRRRAYEYVPGAIAMPRDLTSAKACAVRIAEFARTKLEAAKVVNVHGIDFSPARPKA